jgi:hypothetical protein
MKMLMRERFVSSNDDIPSNKLELPLLHDDCTSNSCDKKELCDDSSITYMPQLEHKLDIVSSNPISCAEIRTFNLITIVHIVHDELKLLCSLNTLGYIEFDVLCNLNNLEEKLSFSVDLPWLCKHTYHVIGRYNWKGEYMVHQVYICSNMKSIFVMKQYDQLDGCVKANHITSSFTCPLYVLQQQGQLQEGEQSLTTSNTTLTAYADTNDFESRTTQNQEGENDEYMDVNYMVKAKSIIDSQAQEKLNSSLFDLVRTARVGLTKMDAQVTYGLRFRCFRYCWKAKKISFPTHLVSHQNMLEADGNRYNKMTSKIYQKSVTPVSWPKGLIHPRVARPPPCPPPESRTTPI